MKLNLDPSLLAKAAESAKKAVYIKREYTLSDILTLQEYHQFCRENKIPCELNLAKKNGKAIFSVTEREGKDGTPQLFYDIIIPLTDGATAEVRASRRARNEDCDGDSYKVSNLRALLYVRGDEPTWVFDDITLMDPDEIKSVEEKKKKMK